MKSVDICNTYSIVARDPQTGDLGVAVQTHQIGVGRLVPWLLPGIGAIATQALVNVSFGPVGLTLLRQGASAVQAVAALIAADSGATQRQIAIVDANGRAEAYTGRNCIREAGHYIGEGYSVQANMMTRNTVVDAMRKAYEDAGGDFVSRLLMALYAAQAEDGDIRGMQSAALKIVSGDRDTPEWQSIYDIRVDEHDDPLVELSRLVKLRWGQLLDAEGHALLTSGDVPGALMKWKLARETAPALEEIAFWQAVALADQHPDEQSISIAGRILALALENDQRRDQWLDLIGRLAECGMIQNEVIAMRLIDAMRNA
jgi:uncharacterized Ntn-hydrolase superfamily protein